MKKEILIRGVVMPIVIALLLCIAFLVPLKSSFLCPVPRGTVVAYHDDQLESDAIGTISFDKTQLNLFSEASYSNMVNGASIMAGTELDETGCTYIEIFQNNAMTLLERDITINVGDDMHSYRFVKSFGAKDENAVWSNKSRIKKGVVIYYQKSVGVGFSSDYEALVYEEVQ